MVQNSKAWQKHRPDRELSLKLSDSLGISPVTAQVLINRNIDSGQKASEFLKPKLAGLSDPFDIPGMRDACKRVLLAKERGELVMVYGDYDVDGVTGTVIILETLRFLGINCGYYIPHRYDEGYGLNAEAVREIKEKGAGLIVTVDCGIGSWEEVHLANSLGMDVVVTDHHVPPKKLPSARALVNPKLIKGEHPSRELSGAGVAFKFSWALLKEAGIRDVGMMLSLLDLTSLGTIADVVPLVDENRILAVQGLESIASRKRVGLRCLMDAAGINGNITSTKVNFGISPRINAAGRLEHASLAVDLLLSRDEDEAREIAGRLNRINVKRQEIGSKIQEEVFLSIRDKGGDDGIIISQGRDWHPGVIGIVASRVVDEFYRPTVLVGVADGVGRGSARSVDGFNIFEVLDTCRDLFLDFGGHESAAGFEIDADKIPELAGRLKKEANKKISVEELVPRISIDAEIGSADISMGLLKELETLSPFGKGNPEPVFLTKGLKLSNWRHVGKGSHLKAKFSSGRAMLDVIGFGMGEYASMLDFSSSYDIVYTLRVSEWEGFEFAELRLVDMKKSTGGQI